MARGPWRQHIDFHCVAVSLSYRELQASEQLDLNHLMTVQQKKTNHTGSRLGSPVDQSNCRFLGPDGLGFLTQLVESSAVYLLMWLVLGFFLLSQPVLYHHQSATTWH